VSHIVAPTAAASLDLTDPTVIAAIIAIGSFVFGSVNYSFGAWHRRRRRDLLDEIAKLREQGVEVRNRGTLFESQTEEKQWAQDWDAWRQRVLDRLAAFGRHEALGFKTIGQTEASDLIGGPYLRATSPTHQRNVALMTADLRHLDEIRRRYSVTT
jgi:hypothetical protein